MTRHHEELDEVIDRIAAAVTFVPADPALAARVAEGARVKTATVFRWPGPAAAVAAIVLVVIASSLWRQKSAEQMAEQVIATTPIGVEAFPVIEPAPTAAANPSRVRASTPVRGVLRSAEGDRPEPGVPQIEALSSPAPLSVRELPTDSLTIAPVDLAPLDLASLALAEIDSRDDPKE